MPTTRTVTLNPHLTATLPDTRARISGALAAHLPNHVAQRITGEKIHEKNMGQHRRVHRHPETLHHGRRAVPNQRLHSNRTSEWTHSTTKNPISQDLGRIRGVAYTIRMWIKYWWVLDRRGWVQPQENEPGR